YAPPRLRVTARSRSAEIAAGASAAAVRPSEGTATPTPRSGRTPSDLAIPPLGHCLLAAPPPGTPSPSPRNRPRRAPTPLARTPTSAEPRHRCRGLGGRAPLRARPVPP